MKLKNNQSGVAHVAAIGLLVVIAAIAFVGWKVWDSRSNTVKPAEVVVSQKTPEITNTSFKSNKVKLSFEIPKGFKLTPNDTELCPDLDDVESIGFETPDYKYETGESFGDYTVTGATIGIDAAKVSKTERACYGIQDSVEDIITGKTTEKGSIENIKKVKVNGKPAIQYNSGYEGTSKLITQIDTEDTSYEISIFVNFDKPGQYLKTYQTLIQSLDI